MEERKKKEKREKERQKEGKEKERKKKRGKKIFPLKISWLHLANTQISATDPTAEEEAGNAGLKKTEYHLHQAHNI